MQRCAQSLAIVIVLAGGLVSPVLAYESLDLARLIHQQVQRCWTPPAGYEGHEVSVDMVLRGDGSLDGRPEIAPVSGKAQSKLGPFRDSAARAIARCAPFSGLEGLGVAPDARLELRLNFQS